MNGDHLIECIRIIPGLSGEFGGIQFDQAYAKLIMASSVLQTANYLQETLSSIIKQI